MTAWRSIATRLRDETAIVSTEVAIWIGVFVVGLIPAVTLLTHAVDGYLTRHADNVQQAELKSQAVHDSFMLYLEGRLAFMRCMHDLPPGSPSAECDSP